MKVHKLRFKEDARGSEWPNPPQPGRFRKSHEVTVSTETSDTTSEQMVTWTNSIVIDKLDIEFLMESEA